MAGRSFYAACANDDEVDRAQASGVRSLICQLVAEGSRARTWRRYASGSRPRRRHDSTMVYKMALRSPASASPMNNQFFLLWKAFHNKNYDNIVIMQS
jgi:hypothetical protein